MTFVIKQKICRYCHKCFLPKFPQTVYCSVGCAFWSKVNIKAPNQCWEWNGSRHPEGYGHFRLHNEIYNASRVAWELTYGPIPEGVCVCHKCDNPPCVNPNHLFLGSRLENTQDRDNKNRRIVPKGASNKTAKLNKQTVGLIEHLIATGQFQKDIAKKFDVGTTTISRIKHKKHWATIVN